MFGLTLLILKNTSEIQTNKMGQTNWLKYNTAYLSLDSIIILERLFNYNIIISIRYF